MDTTGKNVRKRESREAAAKELVEEMYREWRIRGEKPRNCEMMNPTEKLRQCCLVNKAIKEGRIATILGRRIIDGTSAPFYDEKTKRRAALKGDSADTAVIAEGEVTVRTNA